MPARLIQTNSSDNQIVMLCLSNTMISAEQVYKMNNKSVRNYLITACLLIPALSATPVFASWNNTESETYYKPQKYNNGKYGDFVPADINQKLFGHLNTDAEKNESNIQIENNTVTPGSAQTASPGVQQVQRPPQNAAQNRSQQYYQQPVYNNYNQSRQYNPPGNQRYNRNTNINGPGNNSSNFRGPWNNSGSNFSGPWNNNGSNFSGPWNNNSSNFSEPWNNNGSSFSMPWGNNNGSNSTPWGNGGSWGW